MRNENIKRPSVMKVTAWVLIIICASFVAYYSVMSMMGPSRKLEALKKEYIRGNSGKKSDDQALLDDSAYLRLLKERAWLQSKTLMAETDSIYLTINLADSTINVEISGVAVHDSRMSNVSVSRMIMKGNENVVYSMLSTPMTIASSLATIKKEPVMIKMAPKDTADYKPDIIPDTSITKPVNYILEMTNGIRIYVYQEEDAKFSDRMSRFTFDINDRLHETWSAIKSVLAFKVPVYHPFIKIYLPRSDAKIIYRAVQVHGQLTVYL